MRPLAQSEKTLFLILCGAVFIALNMLGLRAFLQARTKVQQAIVVAKTELATDHSWIDLAASLQPAMHWVINHPMPEMQTDEASARLLKIEQGEAEKAGLKVMEPPSLAGSSRWL